MDALVDHCRKKILRLQISLFHIRKELRKSFFQFLYEGCRETEHVHGDMLIFCHGNRIPVVVCRVHAVLGLIYIICLCDLGEVSIIVHSAHAAGYRTVFA